MQKLNHNSVVISTLKNSFIFKNMSENVLIDISHNFTQCFYKKNEIIGISEIDKYVFIIIKGRVKMMQTDIKDGRIVTLFLYTKGDIFDILPLLDGKEHNVQFKAIDNISLLKVPIIIVRQWIKQYPNFNVAFLPYLGQKMRELENLSETLVFYDTKTRLAELILKHTMPKQQDNNDNNDSGYVLKLISDLSHETIAEMIGSVRSVVTTQLNELKKNGVLSYKKRNLIVENLEKLKKRCNIF